MFEVDGEHRYDFDCDFGSVEVRDTTTLTTTTTISEGQNIIANSIQIEDKAAMALDVSTCSSSSSCYENNNNENDLNNDCDEWQSGPVVCWPASVEKLVKQVKPKPDVMVMMMPNAAAAAAAPTSISDVSMTSITQSADYYSYYGTPYCPPQPQPEQQKECGLGSFTFKAVKRVQFMDAHQHHQHMQQTAF